MCNLYSMTAAPAAIARLFRLTGPTPNWPPQPRIRPTHDVPVIAYGKSGERTPVLMRWGFVLPQGDDRAPKPVTNARFDKIASSPFWKASFTSRRCLVPVTAFCEWSADKTEHWFTLPDADADGLFAFAGLWRSWRGTVKGEAVDWITMAFVTCPPNDVVAPIHPKAMPVILTGDAMDRWIDGSTDEALDLARPYDGAMTVAAAGARSPG